jgi:hypothetical protein
MPAKKFTNEVEPIRLLGTDQEVRVILPRDGIGRLYFVRVDAETILSVTSSCPRHLELWKVVRGIYHRIADITVQHAGVETFLKLYTSSAPGEEPSEIDHHQMRAAPFA